MKMRLFIAGLAIFLSHPGSLFCNTSETKVCKAIEVLIGSPNSSAARRAGRFILKFAGTTPDYHIQISLCYLPWAASPKLPEGSQMLLVAFVAGNLQEQIRKNSSQPEPYAGSLAVIEVYQKMLRERPGFKIPKVEDFIAMKNQGVLRAHIESLKP